MRIVDCNLSRESQIALYKRGFTTVESLSNSDVNYMLFELKGLKHESVNVVNEVKEFLIAVQSGKNIKLGKGNSIAREIGLDYPKNLLDFMVKELEKVNSPLLSKKPFTDKGNPQILIMIDSLLLGCSSSNLKNNVKRILLYRFKMLYTLSDVASMMNIKPVSALPSIVSAVKDLSEEMCRLCGKGLSSMQGVAKSKDEIKYEHPIEELALTDDLLIRLRKSGITDCIQLVAMSDESLLSSVKDLQTHNIVEIRDSFDIWFKKANCNCYPYNILSALIKLFPEYIDEALLSEGNKQAVDWVLSSLFLESNDKLSLREKKLLNLMYAKKYPIEIISKNFGTNVSEIKLTSILMVALRKIADILHSVFASEDSILKCRLSYESRCKLYKVGIYRKSELYAMLDEYKKAKEFIAKYSSVGHLINYVKIEDPYSIKDCGFSERTNNCLIRAGIKTPDDLARLSMEQILRVRNLDQKGVNEVFPVWERLNKVK